VLVLHDLLGLNPGHVPRHVKEYANLKNTVVEAVTQFRDEVRQGKFPGEAGELLIQQLERRLDNVAFRLGFAISRRQARQVVRHGHVEVNGRKVNIPSYQVNAGDEIKVRDSAKKLIIIEQGVQYAAQNPVPAWLEANFENLSGRVLHLPKRQDVNLPINEQLIVELYSK